MSSNKQFELNFFNNKKINQYLIIPHLKKLKKNSTNNLTSPFQNNIIRFALSKYFLWN